MIAGGESEEVKNKQELEVSIMGRKFSKHDTTQPWTFLYIGSDENFLSTLSLNLGTVVTLYQFNP